MSSRRALGVFWIVVLLASAGGAAYLHWLGPLPAAETPMVAAPPLPTVPPPAPIPEPPPPVVAEAPPAAIAEPPAPTVSEPPEPPAAPAERAEAPPAPVSPPVVLAPVVVPPAAPEPPPLANGAARRAAADPQIAAPDPLLLEASRHGPVPRLGPDGRTSIRAYARPFDRDDRRPRVALVIGNMGLFAQHSDDAIRRLPGAVTLAFSPYALRPEPLLERARARGMEILVALPLEPAGYGRDADPGDRALLTTASVEDNLDRLDWLLSRIQGEVGAIGALGRLRGERFAQNAELLGTVQAALTNRGLLYVDPRPGAPSPARAFGRTVDLLLDDPSETRGEVERRLSELEALARQNGSALGLAGNPVPSVVAAILAWSAGLEDRGVTMAPVTVLLRRPSTQTARQD